MKKFLFLFILLSSTLPVLASPEKIDMTKWQYNSAENVFYQLGIKYCDNPVDEKFEKLAIFVPAQYMDCVQNNDDTFSCKVNKNSQIKNYTSKTAPIVMPAESINYNSNPALTDYKSVWEYTSEGFVYIHAGYRGQNAPSSVVDLKAAIRYIKFNKNIIPGNINRIFSFGMSESVILGATGNSKLYEPYLKQIGAVMNTDDKILGSASWCPITNLDSANIAYEWNMGATRKDIDEKSKKLSNEMALEYANYINSIKLRRKDGILLTLRETNKGIYQGGSYYNYLENVINQSLTNFLADTLFPIDMNVYGKEEGFAPKIKFEKNQEISDDTTNEEIKEDKIYNSPEEYVNALNADKKWINYDNYKVQILSVEDFVKHMKPASKTVGAFDGLKREQNENKLFDNSHFDSNTAKLLKNTEYEKEFKKDFEKIDSVGNTIETRLNMYNPMYYFVPFYKGYKTSKIAKYWRIRTGINQTDTALTTEVNLSLALKRLVGEKNVDFETVWAMGHVKAERRGTAAENFVNWVNKCLTPIKN